MVKLIRNRLPTPLPSEKKEERHLAGLRDKRDKAKRALDRLGEDAVRKEKVYREAAAKANTQREECDELERQARVQVQLPRRFLLSLAMVAIQTLAWLARFSAVPRTRPNVTVKRVLAWMLGPIGWHGNSLHLRSRTPPPPLPPLPPPPPISV